MSRAAAVVVGLGAAFVYCWNLSVSGYANVYYAGAALAGAQSWSAWFFGSLDPANFITVDKPPLAIMLTSLAVRAFGLSSTSILLPQALLGVASVLVLFATVRRPFGTAAAFISAVVMALTPAAVVMFRYNNPDALLTFLLIAGAWSVQRAVATGRARWLVLAFSLVGLAFNTKFLEAYLVVPAFVFAWLAAAPISLRRRTTALVAAALAGFGTSVWWVAAVQLIPAGQRPFIGGSTDGSAVQLLFGYDGFARIFGATGGSASPVRLFDNAFGDQIAWFIPLAIIGLIGGLLCSSGRVRSDLRVASYLLWGSWFLIVATVFSLMSGTIHSYYSVLLAPAIAVLVGSGVVDLWAYRERAHLAAVALAAGLLADAAISAVLLRRTPWLPLVLQVALLGAGVAASVAVAWPRQRVSRRISVGAVAVMLATLVAAPAAYAISTINTPLVGSGPSASLTAFAPPVDKEVATSGTPVDIGLRDLVPYVVARRGRATWVVAVERANDAATIELASRAPALAMGGFRGSDPAMTISRLRSFVASGRLRFVAFTSPAATDFGQTQIERWVVANGRAVGSVGGVRLYDLGG